MHGFKRLCSAVLIAALMGAASFTLTACSPSDKQAGGYYYSMREDNTVTVYLEKYDMSELIIPESVAGFRVTAVKAPWKKDKINNVLTKIIFPDTIKYIENNAFEGCIGLEEITFPDGLIKIGDSAFEACSSIVRIRVPNGVTTIETDAFKNCSAMTQAYLPNTVTTMGSTVFEGCFDLEIWSARESEPGFWDFWGYNWSGGAKVNWGYDGYVG